MSRIVAFALLLTGCFVLSGCGTSVPDVRGLDLEDATTVIEAAGFVVGSVLHDNESLEPHGAIAEQEPAPGSRAKEGVAVNLTIAGPPPVPIPELSGLNREDAETILAAEGLELGEIEEVFDSEVRQGDIMSQEPIAGIVVPVGTVVSVRVSKGPEPLPVPDVQGKTQAEAQQAIEAAGFAIDFITKYDSAAKGTVLSQDPSPDVAQLPGTRITVTVSDGPELVRVPNAQDFRGSYNGDDFDRVLTSLKQAVVEGFRRAGLSANVEFTSGWVDGPEYRQNPKPGAMVPKGTRVNVVIPTYN